MGIQMEKELALSQCRGGFDRWKEFEIVQILRVGLGLQHLRKELGRTRWRVGFGKKDLN